MFFEYKRQFPNVQIMIDRAYGTRLIEAVVDNQADFGIAQLPVKEKRLEVVRIHSDEVRALLPLGHALAHKSVITASDLAGIPLLMPKTGATRARLGLWLEPVEDDIHDLEWSLIPPR